MKATQARPAPTRFWVQAVCQEWRGDAKPSSWADEGGPVEFNSYAAACEYGDEISGRWPLFARSYRVIELS